jgi:hypothetical protein
VGTFYTHGQKMLFLTNDLAYRDVTWNLSTIGLIVSSPDFLLTLLVADVFGADVVVVSANDGWAFELGKNAEKML